MNIFISIIEDSYVVAKIKNKTSFVYKYLSLDSKLVNPKLKNKKSLLVTENFFNKLAEEKLNESKGEETVLMSYSQIFGGKSFKENFEDLNYEEIENRKESRNSLFEIEKKEENIFEGLEEEIFKKEDYLEEEQEMGYNIDDFKKREKIKYSEAGWELKVDQELKDIDEDLFDEKFKIVKIYFHRNFVYFFENF